MRKQSSRARLFFILLALLQFFAAPSPSDTVSDVYADSRPGYACCGQRLADLAKLAWRAVGQGKEKAEPRDSIYYFDQGGNLNPVRWKGWKLNSRSTARPTSRLKCYMN
jgi:arylsulfatase